MNKNTWITLAVIAVLGLGVFALTGNNNPVDTVTDTVSDGIDAAGDAAGDVGDAVGDAGDAVGDAVGDAADAVGDAVTMNVVEKAIATDDLSTLVAAVKAADLVDTLSGDGPFTVFAPTNAAFDALPAGTLDSLLEAGNKEQLQGILTYHVVAAKAMSSDLSDGQVLATVQGGELTVKIMDGKVMIKDATGAMAEVTTADVATSNGVVHIIDSVVLPE